MWNLCSSLSWLDTSVRSKSDENYKDICHKEVYTQNIDIIHVQIGSEHNCKDLCESFQEKRQKKIHFNLLYLVHFYSDFENCNTIYIICNC